MATDLFTVRADDALELPANIMHWRLIRHVPVRDDAGMLLGIVSHRDLLELFALGKTGGCESAIVRYVMKRGLVVVAP